MITLTDLEATTLLEYCKRSADPADLLIELLLRTGIRAEELYTCTKASIHLVNGQALIRVKGAKGSNDRSLGLPMDLVDRLKIAVAVIGETDSLMRLLPGPAVNAAAKKRSLRNHWARLTKRLGLKTHSLHKLRHTFAVKFLKSNASDPVSLVKLQRLLGHVKLDSTTFYLKYLAELDLAPLTLSLWGDEQRGIAS